MAVTLEPFQERALSQLRSGNVLVGEVGSGKSIVAIMWWLRTCCRTCSGESDSGRTLMPLKGSPDLLIITEAKKRDRPNGVRISSNSACISVRTSRREWRSPWIAGSASRPITISMA